MMLKTFLNPYPKFSESKLLFFGTVAMLAGSLLGFVFQARFDGVIDVHFAENISMFQPLLDNIFNTILLTFVLFVLGKIINKKTRLIDVFIPSLWARVPFYLLTFTNFNNYISNISTTIIQNINLKNPNSLPLEIPDLITLLIFALASIGLLVWFVILLYNGFKIATNCKTVKHTLLFTLGIIVAETASKILLTFFTI